MTPDTCPYCGAPKRYNACAGIEYSCGSWAADNGAKVQSDNCARYVRTRISQLRRMAQRAEEMTRWVWWRRSKSKHDRVVRFRATCIREIDRLRGAT